MLRRQSKVIGKSTLTIVLSLHLNISKWKWRVNWQYHFFAIDRELCWGLETFSWVFCCRVTLDRVRFSHIAYRIYFANSQFLASLLFNFIDTIVQNAVESSLLACRTTKLNRLSVSRWNNKKLPLRRRIKINFYLLSEAWARCHSDGVYVGGWRKNSIHKTSIKEESNK